MPARFIHEGSAFDLTPTLDVPLGTVLVLGSLIAIAHRSIPANTLGSVAVDGVWELPVFPGGTAGIGEPIFWEAAAAQATSDQTAHPTAVRGGVLARPLAAADLVAHVAINR